MKKLFSLSIVILLISFVFANALPLQAQNHINTLRQEEYVPLLAELINRYIENRGNAETLENSIGGVTSPTQSMYGFAPLPEIPFKKTDRLTNLRLLLNMRPTNFNKISRPMFEHFAKRNIDEIDRTAFDSFYKRNFDEIDRVGWIGFTKRLANYLNK